MRLCDLKFKILLLIFTFGAFYSAQSQNKLPGLLYDDVQERSFVSQAVPVKDSPLLDGEVLSDTAWKDAPVISEFWQTTPNEGQPVSERTEVRIVYTNDKLYVGVVCFDREPEGIIISENRRDASLDDSDSFRMIFDTYRDRQNGFIFGTNPAGIEYDAQVTNEGQGTLSAGRQRGGAIGGFNINWDGSWQVRSRLSEIGWSAEFAIPFRTLRFDNEQTQTWGINFQRNIRRRNEAAFWVPLPRQFTLQRVSLAGTLVGLEIPDQRNLKIVPFTVGQIKRDFINRQATDKEGEIGVDVKYSLTPSMTMDVTLNTDFAQVEVDEQQVNLDRFNLFFPEKRPFFLENAGLFSVGSPEEVELFFSRRIGIGPDEEIVPIWGGVRLSGRMANTNIGLLNMQTQSLEGVTTANNFTVARIKQEIPHSRSSIGMLLVNRQGTGSDSPDDNYNRTIAVDGQWGIGLYGQISGFLARTYTPAVTDKQHAFKLDARVNSRAWQIGGGYTEVGDGFNPEVGFLQRDNGFRKPDFLILYRYRPDDFWGFLELRPHISYYGYWNMDDFYETGRWHIDNHWEWKNGYEVHTGVNFRHEGVIEEFEISPDIYMPVGSYDWTEVQLVANTNLGAPVSFQIRAFIGGFFDGHRISMSPGFNFRISDTFNAEIDVIRNDVDLAGDKDFVTNLFRARISYSFTPRIYLQGLVQYNDSDDIWASNLRLGWLETANTGLFIVYNETLDTDGSLLGSYKKNNRNLILKYSRMFDAFR